MKPIGSAASPRDKKENAGVFVELRQRFERMKSKWREEKKAKNQPQSPTRNASVSPGKSSEQTEKPVEGREDEHGSPGGGKTNSGIGYMPSFASIVKGFRSSIKPMPEMPKINTAVVNEMSQSSTVDILAQRAASRVISKPGSGVSLKPVKLLPPASPLKRQETAAPVRPPRSKDSFGNENPVAKPREVSKTLYRFEYDPEASKAKRLVALMNRKCRWDGYPAPNDNSFTFSFRFNELSSKYADHTKDFCNSLKQARTYDSIPTKSPQLDLKPPMREPIDWQPFSINPQQQPFRRPLSAHRPKPTPGLEDVLIKSKPAVKTKKKKKKIAAAVVVEPIIQRKNQRRRTLSHQPTDLLQQEDLFVEWSPHRSSCWRIGGSGKEAKSECARCEAKRNKPNKPGGGFMTTYEAEMMKYSKYASLYHHCPDPQGRDELDPVRPSALGDGLNAWDDRFRTERSHARALEDEARVGTGSFVGKYHLLIRMMLGKMGEASLVTATSTIVCEDN